MFTDALDRLAMQYSVLNLVPVSAGRMYGRVRCAAVEVTDTEDENIQAGLRFYSQLEPGEILFVKGTSQFAYFGQLMGELGERLGIGGAVILGKTRDADALRTGSLPVYAAGCTPVDIKGRGKIGDFDQSIMLNGLAFASGDWLFADSDGVVCFKKEHQKQVEAHVLKAIQYELSLSSRIRGGSPDLFDEPDFEGF